MLIVLCQWFSLVDPKTSNRASVENPWLWMKSISCLWMRANSSLARASMEGMAHPSRLKMLPAERDNRRPVRMLWRPLKGCRFVLLTQPSGFIPRASVRPSYKSCMVSNYTPYMRNGPSETTIIPAIFLVKNSICMYYLMLHVKNMSQLQAFKEAKLGEASRCHEGHKDGTYGVASG